MTLAEARRILRGADVEQFAFEERRAKAVGVMLDALDEWWPILTASPGHGHGLRTWHGHPIVPMLVHDALCGWRVASAQGDDGEPGADILGCSGCGMCYLRSEAAARSGP